MSPPAKGDLAPFVASIRKLETRPLDHYHEFVWTRPNNRDAGLVVAPVTTDAQGRFRLSGVGRDRMLRLQVEGPGIATTEFTVLTRNDVDELTQSVRTRWPRLPFSDRPGGGLSKIEPPRRERSQELPVLLFGSTVELTVDPARTVAGVVREARTGRPLPGVSVWSDGSGIVSTDSQGQYRLHRTDNSDQILVGASDDFYSRFNPSRPILGAVRRVDGVSGLGEAVVDFDLSPGVVVTGRVLEDVTGRPMVAYPRDNCGVPGDLTAAWVYYLPLAANRTAFGGQVGAYYERIKRAEGGAEGLYVGIVGAEGAFRAVVPPGPGVLLVAAEAGTPHDRVDGARSLGRKGRIPHSLPIRTVDRPTPGRRPAARPRERSESPPRRARRDRGC